MVLEKYKLSQMKLRKFPFYDSNKKEMIHVNDRFNFFYFYWQLVLSRQSLSLFDSFNFESHRSLLNKAINAVELDSTKWQKKVDKFFRKHIFFEKSNIILTKNKTLCRRIENLKNKDLQRHSLTRELKKLEKYLVNNLNYSKLVSQCLIELLHQNESLTKIVEKQIKFLVNALIVELYFVGFDVGYIKGVPHIITFSDPLNDYPYSKTSEDFEHDKDEYESYKKSFKPSLKTFLDGIENLVTQDKFHGYIIYKVFNLEITNTIEIGDTIIYNPQLEQKTDRRKNRSNHVETFYDEDQKINSFFTSRSSCNILTPIAIKYPLRGLEKRRAIIDSYDKLSKILKYVTLNFRVSNPSSIYLSREHFFLSSKNRKINYFSFAIFGNFDKVSELDPNKIESQFVNKRIKNISKLNSTILLHENLKKLIDVETEFAIESNNFKFSDLWIAWEALVDISGMKSLFKLCLKLRYQRNFIGDQILVLNRLLNEHGYPKVRFQFTLSEDELTKYGLNFRHMKPLRQKKFISSYKKLFKRLDTPALSFFENRIEFFINNSEEFYEEMDTWIDNTVEEFNIERNSEVHNNNENDFSYFKLKEAILFMSYITTSAIIENINSRNKNSIKLIKKRIKKLL